MLNFLSITPMMSDEEELFAAFFGIFFIFIIFAVIIGLICAVITLIAQWKVFEKAGRPGWAAIIPFYNTWVFFEMGDVNPKFMFFGIAGSILSMIPNIMNIVIRLAKTPALYPVSVLISLLSMCCSIAMIVFTVIACINLAKKFGKGTGFGLGLAFLGVVFFPLLALDKDAVYTETTK